MRVQSKNRQEWMHSFLLLLFAVSVGWSGISSSAEATSVQCASMAMECCDHGDMQAMHAGHSAMSAQGQNQNNDDCSPNDCAMMSGFSSLALHSVTMSASFDAGSAKQSRPISAQLKSLAPSVPKQPPRL